MTTSTDRRQGLNSSAAIKVPCRACATTNITLSGEQTIDGIALVTNDRVLLTGQTTTSANGIYDVNTSTWTRSKDWDGVYDCVTGTLVYVTAGTVNSGYWYISTTGTITVDSTSVTIGRSSSVLANVSTFMQTVIDDTTAALARTTLGAVGLTGNETIAGDKAFTGTNTHSGNESFTGTVNITTLAGANLPVILDTSAGANVGPYFDLQRFVNRAANDYLGMLRFTGNNASGSSKSWTELLGRVTDATNATEDATLNLRTIVAGAMDNRLVIGAGTYSPNAAGGDKGADSSNFLTSYINGEQLFTNGLVLLDTKTASNSATLDFTTALNSTYKQYVFVFDEVLPATNGAILFARISTDGGSSFISTGTYLVASTAVASSGAPTVYVGSTTEIKLSSGEGVLNSAGNNGAHGWMNSYSPSSAKTHIFEAVSVYLSSAVGSPVTKFTATAYESGTTALNAIRFLFSSGNITSGVIRLYGVKK